MPCGMSANLTALLSANQQEDGLQSEKSTPTIYPLALPP